MKIIDVRHASLSVYVFTNIFNSDIKIMLFLRKILCNLNITQLTFIL